MVRFFVRKNLPASAGGSFDGSLPSFETAQPSVAGITSTRSEKPSLRVGVDRSRVRYYSTVTHSQLHPPFPSKAYESIWVSLLQPQESYERL